MRLLLVLTAVLAVLNGIFSPMWIVVFALQAEWYPAFLPGGIWLPVSLSAVLLSVFYMLLSGVPAALYERLRHEGATITSRSVWLVTMSAMSWPSLPGIARALG